MNKRTVNISSLVLLLSLLSLITTMCLYYLVPRHYVSVIFAGVASVLLAHFFLESSLNYDYNFLHAASMTISTLVFAIAIYVIQPNEWICFDFWLPCLVLANWIIPFLYCTLRDLFDRGPRFDGYHQFFNRMCIFFTLLYIFVIAKQYFIRPIVPIEIRSSSSLSDVLYFLTIYATNRRFFSIRSSLALLSPTWYLLMHSSSSFALIGFGKDCTSSTSKHYHLYIMPVDNILCMTTR